MADIFLGSEARVLYLNTRAGRAVYETEGRPRFALARRARVRSFACQECGCCRTRSSVRCFAFYREVVSSATRERLLARQLYRPGIPGTGFPGIVAGCPPNATVVFIEPRRGLRNEGFRLSWTREKSD